MKNLNMPDQELYAQIYKNTKLINGKIYLLLQRFYKSVNTEVSKETIDLEYILENWTKYEYFKALVYKMQHVLKSIVMMNFYKSQIKADDNWMGDIFDVFPDYEKNDFYTKDWFDYFSDNFFTQISSSFDLIGHVLNIMLCLRIKNVAFESVVCELNQRKIKKMYGRATAEKFMRIRERVLRDVIQSENYRKYKAIRNDTIHNLTPSFPLQKAVTSLNKDDKIISGHVIPIYFKSEERMILVDTLSQLLLDTLNIIVIEIAGSEQNLDKSI